MIQIYSISHQKTFAQKLIFESFPILIAFSEYFSYETEQMNIPDGFSKSDFTETIYTEILQNLYVIQK